MQINYYYSDELTADTEGDLVQLCRNCAEENAGQVEWASRGDEESECELCGKANDPDRAAFLDSLSDVDLMNHFRRTGDFLSAEAMRNLIRKTAA